MTRHPRAPRWLDRQKLGLIVLGVLWVGLGIYVVDGASSKPDGAPHTLMPDDLRGGVWILSGLWALAAARWAKLRPIAYGLCAVMPIVRTVSYGVAGIVWYLPDSIARGGAEFAWYSMLFNAALLALVYFLATDRQESPPHAEDGAR